MCLLESPFGADDPFAELDAPKQSKKKEKTQRQGAGGSDVFAMQGFDGGFGGPVEPQDQPKSRQGGGGNQVGRPRFGQFDDAKED